MRRQSRKPDSSFFRKIAIGAVGTQAVVTDLQGHGHAMIELERGSLGAKIWKEVKRKRVRIPDLACKLCGQRVESRAKTDRALSMSHSPTDESRVWDFGMVDTDWIAFPVCEAIQDEFWGSGRLGQDASYWHERNWVRWRVSGGFNYFQVAAFRAVPPTSSSTKGAEEGSETSIGWTATFSKHDGTVEFADLERVTVRPAVGRRQTWKLKPGREAVVSVGDTIRANQVVIATVRPVRSQYLRCAGALPADHINHLISSRERTQRFTGVKLARVRGEAGFAEEIGELTRDREEDVYVRLEGAAYLASVCEQQAEGLFRPFLSSTDNQIQLEAVISLGETATEDAVRLLSDILDITDYPYFLRSAAAWSLGQIGDEASVDRLIRAFHDVDHNIREEALECIGSVGPQAITPLLAGIVAEHQEVAAGCAEALRQQRPLTTDTIVALVQGVRAEVQPTWTTWLLGHLPRAHVAPAIAELQTTEPELHYAISLLWAFTESWIARRWELNPGPIQRSGNNAVQSAS